MWTLEEKENSRYRQILEEDIIKQRWKKKYEKIQHEDFLKANSAAEI